MQIDYAVTRYDEVVRETVGINWRLHNVYRVTYCPVNGIRRSPEYNFKSLRIAMKQLYLFVEFFPLF